MSQKNSQELDEKKAPGLLTRWFRYLRFLLSIRGGTDVSGTIEEICENVKLRGANTWLLVCSALLASIGLDVNSTAVIIGAMLISPLMSPILGVGLSVATLDRQLLKTSVGSLGIATFVSLLTSVVYFLVSPFAEITAELSARTTPTILDIGVAFFGGVAGVVAGSRKRKTNAIPGVAIATALMPPVCTAGFGLATGDWTTFLGAFYLFFINAFFIALATYLIAIWLKFPKKARLDEEQGARVRQTVIAFAVVVSIPSALIMWGVLDRLQTERGIRNLINAEFRKDDRQAFRWTLSEEDGRRLLKIYAFGAPISFEEEQRLRRVKNELGLSSVDMKIYKMNVSPSEFKNITGEFEASLVDGLRALSEVDQNRSEELEELRNALADLTKKTDPLEAFAMEVTDRYSAVEAAEWRPPTTSEGAEASTEKTVLSVKFKPEAAEAERVRDLRAIGRTLAERWPKRGLTAVEEKQENAVTEPAQ
ncbi:MAG: DUF389 domain-containing protein [Acidobacteria bacterium]|nr:DUF389 domain-containing protein [Acidobacteriota bacterium]